MVWAGAVLFVENIVLHLPPLHLEGLTTRSDLNDGLAKLDHSQVIESGLQVHDLTAVIRFTFNLLSEYRYRCCDQRRNNKDAPEAFHKVAPLAVVAQEVSR